MRWWPLQQSKVSAGPIQTISPDFPLIVSFPACQWMTIVPSLPWIIMQCSRRR